MVPAWCERQSSLEQVHHFYFAHVYLHLFFRRARQWAEHGFNWCFALQYKAVGTCFTANAQKRVRLKSLLARVKCVQIFGKFLFHKQAQQAQFMQNEHGIHSLLLLQLL